jgi:(p)ppGpp synthase/HD superfamily hydrolase
MIEYTKKQGQYLTYIYYYTKLNGEPPSEADMQRYFRASPPTVHQMVLKLEEKGLISRIPNTPRSIKVVVPSNQIPELGEPIERKGEILKQVWSQEKYTRAYWFAAEAHKAQLIPGKDLPYLIHIGLVSMEIIACLNVEKEHDGDLAVQCAILHDVIEDTSIMYPEIEVIFGERVAQGVLALTKDKKIPKERRIQDSLQRIRQQPHEVWMVKLADRISNLAAPPQYWEKEKIVNYREEAIEIYDALYDASHYLSKRLEKKIDEYQVYL